MKQVKGFGLASVIIIIIITAIVASITTGVIMLNSNVTIESNKVLKDEDLKNFVAVYETLLGKYYDDVDKKGMLNAAEDAMLNFLGDKYTTYLEHDEYNEILEDLAATYEGIGIMIIDNVVEKVVEDSPASKAGLLKGDIITKINGSDVTLLDSTEISDLVKNLNDAEINIEVKRDENIINVTLKKDTLLNEATYSNIIDNNIGYLQITKFSENLEEQVKNTLKELESKGITSLVIDLRSNVGGYLSEAEKVSSLFLEEGKVIYSLEDNNSSSVHKDETKEKREYPIVVIINGNTASAAEILAGALKDSYGATLVGTKSFGKGKVQQITKLKNGDSLKYTSAKWQIPSGICIDGIGLMPDYEVNLSDDGVDYQLDKAVSLLKG